MPVRLGTSAPSLRLGSSAVSKAYLGTTLVYSLESPVTPPTQPTAPPPPTNMAAVAGDATATISWQSAAGTTAWIAQYSSTNGASWSDIPSGGVSFSAGPTPAGAVTIVVTATVTGLSNGTTYIFRAAAQKSGLWSDYSAPSSPVVPLAVATTPTALTPSVVTGLPYVFIGWDGGTVQETASGSVDHWLEKSVDSGATWTPSGSWRFNEASTKLVSLFGYDLSSIPDDTGGPGQAFGPVVTSFLPSTSYVFRLRRAICARLPDGQCALGPYSNWSATSAAITTPPAVPSAPTGVSAEPFSGGIAVTWFPPPFTSADAPMYEGVSPSVTYELTATPMSGSGSPVTASIAASSAPNKTFAAARNGTAIYARRAVLTGLTNGVAYTVSVAATNSAGTGPSASVSNITPVATIPCALESLYGEPRSCTTIALSVPSYSITYPGAALVVGIAEWNQWPGTTSVRNAQTEVQYTMSTDLAAQSSTGVAGDYASGWFKPAAGSATKDAVWELASGGASAVYRMYGEAFTLLGRTASRRVGPPLAYGKEYVFRVRKSTGTVVSPWTYATFTAPTCGMV